MARQLAHPGHVVFWELVQNTPIVFGVGIALRIVKDGILSSFAVMVIGTLLSALTIELTQKYKRRDRNRPFRPKDFFYNSITFTFFSLLYLIYFHHGSYFIDVCFGFILGLMGTITQWVALKLDKLSGIRHTIAISCAACITLLGFRLSTHQTISMSLIVLFCTTLLMTGIIAIIDYGSR